MAEVLEGFGICQELLFLGIRGDWGQGRGEGCGYCLRNHYH